MTFCDQGDVTSGERRHTPQAVSTWFRHCFLYPLTVIRFNFPVPEYLRFVVRLYFIVFAHFFRKSADPMSSSSQVAPPTAKPVAVSSDDPTLTLSNQRVKEGTLKRINAL